MLLGVVITAALLGGTYYFAVLREAGDAAPAETTWTTLEPGGSPGTLKPEVSAETSSAHTGRIIRCHDPEAGEFYTNAATCEDADPHNRITIAEPLATTPGQDRYSGQDYKPPEQEAGNSRTD